VGWQKGHWRRAAAPFDDGFGSTPDLEDLPEETMSLTAQILLYDGFDPLDAIAPFEVLAAGTAMLTAGGAPDGELTVELVAAGGARQVVSGTLGLTLQATSAFDPDLAGYVVVPGAVSTVDGVAEGGVPPVPGPLREFAAGPAVPLLGRAFSNPAVTVAAACGGSLALALAGLIAGRPAVTHALGADALRAAGAVAIAARVVDDGDLISGGGVTSGLDLGLYLLEREYGPQLALAVEHLFEYERRGTVWRDSTRSSAAA
jgi:transcriptional regulator GlxA family with amidase domain